jgi:hypothetical protein
MRLTTSHRQPARRTVATASRPRHRVAQAIARSLGAMTGKRRRDAERARERFERLDVDQRVREMGEW